MSHGLLLTFEVTILVLAIFLGFEVISKVPTLLHTPLMSGTNAIHGIVIVGAMLVAGLDDKDTLTTIVGFVAVVLASANVVGGFVVTDRMLEMFKKREKKPEDPVSRDSGREHQARGPLVRGQGCYLGKGEGGLWRRVIAVDLQLEGSVSRDSSLCVHWRCGSCRTRPPRGAAIRSVPPGCSSRSS